MINRKVIAPALLTLMVALSCTRDPIYDEVSRYRINFEFPDSVLYLRPVMPELIEVLFFDPATGKKVDETYMAPQGGYLYSFTPGTYNVIAFALGPSRVSVNYPKDFSLITAETNLIQSSPVRIINAPEHFFVGTTTPAEFPFLSEADPPYTLTIPMHSLCDSWNVTVTGIRGLQYASSLNLYVFNQAEEVALRDLSRQGISAISVSGRADLQKGTAEYPFCTFGMSPDGQILIRVVIEAQDRQTHSREFDITSQVRDPLNTGHLIVVDFPTELSPMIQGGLDPSADEWDDHHEFIDVK